MNSKETRFLSIMLLILSVFIVILICIYFKNTVNEINDKKMQYDTIQIYSTVVDKDKETKTYTTTSMAGKVPVITTRTKIEYSLIFNDKNEIHIKVEENDYNNYDIGDTYVIIWKDTEENRELANQYFDDEKINYVKYK